MNGCSPCHSTMLSFFNATNNVPCWCLYYLCV